MRPWCWLLLCCWPLFGQASPASLQLVLLEQPQSQLLTLSRSQLLAREPLSNELRSPLGSVWKLLVYGYLADNQYQEPAYRCQGHTADEVYCCEAGQQIERDQALARSCGLYFAPQRLHLDAEQWRQYWRDRRAPDWLQELHQLTPEREVPVYQLLQVLADLPAQAQARQALLDVSLEADQGALIATLGSRLRVKTWSWKAAHDPQSREGGFAGWLADGQPVWARGPGTSARVLHDYAQVLEQHLPVRWPQEDGPCVEVQMFSRYPIQSLRQNAQPVESGVLNGHYQVVFSNGNQLPIESRGDLFLLKDAGQWQLVAHLSREQYVARVLDREASAEPLQAARALAITIRTYLLQNAQKKVQCLAIDDSSAKQRVAPRPASQQAQQIAAWTADLVLTGAAVGYHLDQPGRSRLVWNEAVAQAEQGQHYDRILQQAFAQASLSRWDRPQAACMPLPKAQQWLLHQLPKWRRSLEVEPGYQESQGFQVCRLHAGRPYVDRARQRIFVRGLLSLNERLALTHEYLHLAFAAHPNGMDEDYVESLARQLLLE